MTDAREQTALRDQCTVFLTGLIELPQRDLGGQQPDWDDLRAQTEWAWQHGAAAHLDGARLFESADRHAGGFRRGGPPAGRRARHMDLAAGHGHARSRCAAGGAVRRRRHPCRAAR